MRAVNIFHVLPLFHTLFFLCVCVSVCRGICRSLTSYSLLATAAANDERLVVGRVLFPRSGSAIVSWRVWVRSLYSFFFVPGTKIL